MALTNDDVMIRIGDFSIRPATTNGEKNVFTPDPFILTKPEWIPDSKASSCVLCKEKFTQVRRRHHCRVCGNVLCGKCCFEKVYLPQYGDDEQSRVCNACLPVSIMITKARSLQMALRLESAKSLADACAEEKMLKKVVETGGVQAIIHLAQTNIADIKETVAEALNNLALCIPLHSMVVNCGGVKAICSILSSTGDSHSQATIKALGTLKLLAKSEKLKVLVVAEGALVPLMALSMSTNNTIVVLSLTTLGIILENPINVATFAQNFKNGLQTMLRIAKSNDEKVQEVSLRILALLARTTDELRKKILEEDNYCGNCIKNSLKRCPKNLEVYSNGVCAIANLAVCPDVQSALLDFIDIICNLIVSHSENFNIQLQVSRAVANFSKHKENSRFLVSYLPLIISSHVNCTECAIRTNGLRTIFYLVEYQPDATISALIKNDGINGLMRGLLLFPESISRVRETLLQNFPEIGFPL